MHTDTKHTQQSLTSQSFTQSYRNIQYGAETMESTLQQSREEQGALLVAPQPL